MFFNPNNITDTMTRSNEIITQSPSADVDIVNASKFGVYQITNVGFSDIMIRNLVSVRINAISYRKTNVAPLFVRQFIICEHFFCLI